MTSNCLRLAEIYEEIARIQRVRPHLRDLGDVAAQDCRLVVLCARRDALVGQGVAA